MATSTTRTKQTNALGKEKRISTSPITSSNETTKNATHQKTNHVSLPTAKVSSNNHTKPSSSNPISDKQIPNYLKPTQSSRHESSHYVKKVQGHEETTHKPSLSRRRSFDKPPSASRLHRGLISPGPRERTMTAAAKTNASLPKMGTDRVSKNLKTGKGQEVYVKSSVKKGASLRTKRELSPKRIDSIDVGKTVNIEREQQVLDSVVDDIDGAMVIETETTVPRPETQNSEINEDIGIQGEKAHQICDISTVCEGLKATPTTSLIEKAEEEKLHEEESQFEKEEENHKELVESYEANEDAKEDVVEENSDVAVSQENNNDNSEHGKDAHEKQDVNEGNTVFVEEVESKDGKDADNTSNDESKTKEEENTAALKHRGGQGKKEFPAAYNDVIEETASKLLEKRKNKVKALVGAFETVIDYESSSK